MKDQSANTDRLVEFAEQNLDRQLVHLEDHQICGIWPDGTAIRGSHLKNLIAEVRRERTCTSFHHVWQGPPVGHMWEPDAAQFCVCGCVRWLNRDKSRRMGYKTVRSLADPAPRENE